MESQTFKKVIHDLLLEKHFLKKGSYYRYITNGIIIVIGLQRSGYSNAYYINVGYKIIELNPSLENPRDTDGDIRARFAFERYGKMMDCFDLDDLSENDQDKLRRQIEANLEHYVVPVSSVDKLKILLQQNPVMLYQTILSAKKMLGFQ